MATKTVPAGIYDIEGGISYQQLSAGIITPIDFLFTMFDVADPNIIFNRNLLSTVQQTGFTNLIPIPPFAMEFFGETLFRLEHLTGADAPTTISGWLLISKRN